MQWPSTITNSPSFCALALSIPVWRCAPRVEVKEAVAPTPEAMAGWQLVWTGFWASVEEWSGSKLGRQPDVWGCFLGFIWFIWLYWLWTLKHVWFKWTEPRNIRVNWCISLGAHAAGRKVNRRCLEWRNVHWIPFFCWRNQRPMNLHGHNMVYVSLLESHLIWSQWLLVYWYSEYFRVRFKAGKTLWASLCVDLLWGFFCVFGQCVSISNSYEYGKLFIPMP